MPSLVPGMHVLLRLQSGKTWMAGTTSPAMTSVFACTPTSISNSHDTKRVEIVIASEAKQSILQHKERMDCFVASLLAMTLDITPRGTIRT
jgi:hypothetical protein